ncbi:hypothetical protein, conserved [Eimeria tenella]|uniref:Uncharacterized protein n=1 Tax=Eimeria tenella TaxID=5802 RepID=U6KRC5_EIMTE|nr:hypothetical protein, conserved [Eimeria tenella]CDJ37988.1 hypothetical protein, conserved [Eimeria tenella]|eukprot:XP_013228826.1 hypothetical protein, conserved [Eimeria tenella]
METRHRKKQPIASLNHCSGIKLPVAELGQLNLEIFLRRWGVGNKGCHDGIVLAFVKNLKTVSLATRGMFEVHWRRIKLRKLMTKQKMWTLALQALFSRHTYNVQ